MPLSGVLGADFASFFDACQKAEVHLTAFESGGVKVEAQLNRVSDAFSGKRMIQEATLMSEVFERAGGSATFTSAELLKMGTAAHEARAKLVALGQEVPPGLQRLSDATQNAANAARGAQAQQQGLTDSLKSFDGVMSQVGVNIGPQIKAIEDIAGASGKTASQLGLVSVAGLVVGAGMAGWQIGRAAADFLNLDEVIGNATAKLLGFGDVAGEKAAAAADQMAKASKYAGFEVKELGLAQMLNAQAAKEAIKANIDYSDQLLRAKGPEESQKQLAAWRKELDDVKASGVLPGLTADLQSQNFSMAELAKRYVISAEALAIYAKEVANVDKVHEKNKAAMAKMADQWKAAEEKIAEEHAKSLEAMAKYEAAFDDQLVQLKGTTTDREISEIRRAEREQIATLERRGQATKENLDRVHAATKKALDSVGVEWDTVREKSLSALKDTADRELTTYQYMVAHANDFTRGALQAQLEKYREARDAATAWGQAAIEGQDAAADAAKRHNAELDEQLQKEKALKDLAEKNAAIRSGGKFYTIDAEGNAHAAGNTITGPELQGKVTPISDQLARDPQALAKMIAQLTKTTSEYNAAPPQTFFGAGANDSVRAANALVQTQLDNLKQLEYLQKLVSLLSSSSSSSFGSATPPQSPRQIETPPPPSSAGSGIGRGSLSVDAAERAFEAALAANYHPRADGLGHDLNPGGTPFEAEMRDGVRYAKGAPYRDNTQNVPLSRGGGNVTLTVNVNVSGVWDPASARKIGEVVGAELMAQWSLGRQFETA